MSPEQEEERDALVNGGLSKKEEEMLKEAHSKQYTGTDDNMPDDYESWLQELPLEDLYRITKGL